jgi:hypothetical protein
MPRDGSLAVSPERIVADFGGRSEIARRGMRALMEATGGTDVVRSQWAELFRKTCGQDWPRPKARLDRLAKHYGVAYDPARPEVVLFALQSWYVLVVKLLVGHVLADARGRKSPAEEAANGDVRRIIAAVIKGGFFSALEVTDPWPGEPFDWFVKAWTDELEQASIAAAASIADYDPAAIVEFASRGGDLLKPLYESLFPRVVRHALGEYYTPDWLAEHVLDQVGYFGQPGARLLDPTCGSGTFLLAALRRWRQNVLIALRRDVDASRRSEMSTLPIAGFDLHPLAVAAARANYLLAIADLLPAEGFIEVPVFARDAVLDTRPELRTFDFVVGNPPWIAWDNLPDDYRAATKPLWREYGLFSLSGHDARHGGGKKDLSMLVLYAAADRYLRNGGRLGMVITQTLFQSKGAGDGFRRFQIGASGPVLGVLRVDDLVDVRPFGDATNWTSVVTLEKGRATNYPVPYVKWTACTSGAPLPAASRSTLQARPIDEKKPTSPWIVIDARSASEESDSHSLARRPCVGPAEYTAHLGANSGGANAVYWLEALGRDERGVHVRNCQAKAKRAVKCVEVVIEPDLVYPLVRWADVGRWSARPSGYLLLAQDPATRTGIDEARMREDYPRTLTYLRQFEPLLTSRAAYRRYQDRQPFYSMYNVGPYTLAAAKVIWRRMDRMIRAAVVETHDDPLLGPRPIVPQETCVLIACACGDEAHYLCAVLNSAIVHELVAAHSVAGGKGFGTPSILDYVPLKKFDPSNAQHLELVALSRRMHQLSAGNEMQSNDTENCSAIDRLAEIVLVTR